MSNVRKIFYEWDIESYDKHGDIIDHDFSDDFPGLPDDENQSLVLVRNEYVGPSGPDFEQVADLDHRAWAYVEGGKLPPEFCDGYKVPQRFHKRINGWGGTS